MSRDRVVGQHSNTNGSVDRPPPLKRSSSPFFGSITSFVTAPLKSWLVTSHDATADSTPKRSIAIANGHANTGHPQERDSKRPRLYSPPRDHLQPSSSTSSQPPWPINASTSAFPRAYSQPLTNGSTPMPAPLPSSLKRVSTLILDPNDDGSPFNQKRSKSSRNMSLDPVIRATSRDASMNLLGSSPRRSVSRDPSLGVNGPPSPYRMRASMTPQPNSMSSSPIRREFSVARSSIFGLNGSSRTGISPVRDTRRESSAPITRKPLMWDAQVGITTNEDLQRQKGRSVTVAPSTPSERALQALESFRKPLIPPSFAGDPNAEKFLASRRKYAPPPLPPSVVQSTNEGLKTRHGSALNGKAARMARPYSGEGGLKKLLRKRAEEKESPARARSPLKDTAMQTDPDMSSEPPSSPLKGKTGQLSRKATVEDCHDDDELDLLPRKASNGTHDTSRAPAQAKEFAGRVSASRAAAPSRPSNPNAPSAGLGRSSGPVRTERRKNRFAARFDDDESIDEDVDPALAGLPSKEELLKASNTGFDVPSGFSFRTPTVPLPSIPENDSQKLFESIPSASVPKSEAQASPQPSDNSKPIPTLASPAATPNTDRPSPFSFTTPTTKVVSEVASERPPAPSSFAFPAPPIIAVKESDKDQPIGSLPFSFPSSRPSTPANVAPASTHALVGSTSQESNNAKAPEAHKPSLFGSKFAAPSAPSSAPSNSVPSLGQVIPPTPLASFQKTIADAPTLLQAPSPIAGAPGLPETGTPQQTTAMSIKAPSLIQNGIPSPDSSPVKQAPLQNPFVSTTIADTPSGNKAAPPNLFANAGKPSANVFNLSSPAATSDSASSSPFSTIHPPRPSGNVAATTSVPAEATKPSFGGFNFGSTNAPKTQSLFGSTSVTSPNAPAAQLSNTAGSQEDTNSTKSTFNFGTKPSETKSPFAFGAPPSTPPSHVDRSSPFNALPPKTGAFSFNTPATVESRPKTPENIPSTDRMDLSPTREPAKPTGFLNSGASSGFGATPANNFSFSAQKSEATTAAPAPFTFGAATPSPSTPFGDNSTKPPGPPVFNFGVGTPTTPTSNTGFSFGGPQTPKPEGERGASPFSFNAAPSSSTPFGAPANTPFSPNLQPSQSLPSDSRATTPFTFGAPSTSFNFGSQPSSPAATPGSLPPVNGGPTAPFVFGAGASGGEANLFTIGAAPPNQQRTTKSLPRRRTTRK